MWGGKEEAGKSVGGTTGREGEREGMGKGGRGGWGGWRENEREVRNPPFRYHHGGGGRGGMMTPPSRSPPRTTLYGEMRQRRGVGGVSAVVGVQTEHVVCRVPFAAETLRISKASSIPE